tara:strand:- start:3946 stop:5130 length:1185 start_codon:yes stop_codon:yes gene_type:complete
MKIAFVMNSYNAPSELWLQRLINLLRSDIAFLASTDSDERLWQKEIPVLNLYHHYPLLKKALMKVGLKRRRSSRERNNEILAEQLKGDVDIVFVNYLTMAYRLRETLLETQLPVVIHTHGYDTTWNLLSIRTGRKVHSKEYREFVKHISTKALLIANSEDSIERLTNIGVNENRIFRKVFGVPVELNNSQLRQGKRVKILFLGRLIDCKGPDLVIAAFERARAAGMSGELIIAGDGYMDITCRLLRNRSEYREDIKLLGNVTPDEGRELRADCDIFTAHNCTGAISNQVEAFGVSIIEAMAAGLPVVTGRSGGVVDSIVDGVTGFMFTPGDVDEHARILIKLANDPELRAKMGNCAIQRVKEHFSLEQERASLMRIMQSATSVVQPPGSHVPSS